MTPPPARVPTTLALLSPTPYPAASAGLGGEWEESADTGGLASTLMEIEPERVRPPPEPPPAGPELQMRERTLTSYQTRAGGNGGQDPPRGIPGTLPATNVS